MHQRQRNKRILIIIAVLWCSAAAGCSGVGHRMGEASLEAVVWPESGAPARIRYVGSFSRPEDLQIRQGMLSRFWDFLVGTPYRGLVAPYGITVDEHGTIYIVDSAQKNVQIYNTNAGLFDIAPDGSHPLMAPISPAVDTAVGRLYITDSMAGTVRFLPLSGTGSTGEFGKDQMKRPTGIALNRLTNELLVLDTPQAVVLRYDLQSLEFKGRFGSRGAGQGQFNHPANLAVTPSGEILVSDSLNFRVQIFSAAGVFKQTFGKVGDSPGYFSRPKGIAVDSEGNIYVVDALFDNVQIFDTQGRLLLSFGGPGQGPGEFWMPAGICIDSHDRIYVADSYNRRVQIFQYLKQTGTQ
jgi:DNA-binding beta-propeller fold protein YncE